MCYLAAPAETLYFVLSIRSGCRYSSFATVRYGEFKHEVRQFQKSYDNQQAEQISLMV